MHYLSCLDLPTLFLFPQAGKQAALQPTSTSVPPLYVVPDIIGVISVVTDACSVLYPGVFPA